MNSQVQVRDATGRERRFQVVETRDADAAQGRISHKSPVGAALLGQQVGAIVNVKVPSGIITFTVVSIN